MHPDLKPESVFLLGSLKVKVLDCGLARIHPLSGSTGDAQDVAISGAGPAMGTIGWAGLGSMYRPSCPAGTPRPRAVSTPPRQRRDGRFLRPRAGRRSSSAWLELFSTEAERLPGLLAPPGPALHARILPSTGLRPTTAHVEYRQQVDIE